MRDALQTPVPLSFRAECEKIATDRKPIAGKTRRTVFD
jgi:hypothetical protein